MYVIDMKQVNKNNNKLVPKDNCFSFTIPPGPLRAILYTIVFPGMISSAAGCGYKFTSYYFEFIFIAFLGYHSNNCHNAIRCFENETDECKAWPI